MKRDAVTLEVLKNALTAVADEMALTMMRTARSPLCRDTLDFSTALCSPTGDQVAQGLCLPMQLNALPEALKVAIERADGQFAPGDVIITNDPFAGGMHLPDVIVFAPLFSDTELIAFACVLAHHVDVGGRVAGGNAADSREIFEEGIRIPPMKLLDGGQLNSNVMELVLANVRESSMFEGDLWAQISACRRADRDLAQLIRRHGRESVVEYMGHLLDYAEEMTRQEIRLIPDGEYRFTDYLDDDGVSPEPVAIVVKLTVLDDEIVADFTGTSAQRSAAINATLPLTSSCTYFAVRALLSGSIPNNSGFFRPIRVVAPPGTVVNLVFPGACGARGVTGFRVIDTVFGALAKALPDRVFAASDGGSSVMSIGGSTGDSRFVYVEVLSSSWGARPNRDGIEAVSHPAVNMANTPIEAIESAYPLRVRTYALVPDSGGVGRFRGGCGVMREIEFMGDEGVLQLRTDRRRFRPWGLAGGGEGSAALNVLNPETDRAEVIPTKVTRPLKKGDVLRCVLPGGGGFGDPALRDPSAIAWDILEGKVSDTPEYQSESLDVHGKDRGDAKNVGT